MKINPGHLIRVNGKEVTVLHRFAAGKHTQFHLSDGTMLVDLDKRDDVEILNGSVKKEPGSPRKTEIRILTKEEMANEECPFPPEEGYEETKTDDRN